MNQRDRHWPALVILGIFLCLGVLYSITTPIFEASDEYKHYPFVAHLAAGGGLPVQQVGQETLWGQEGSQPPLYYMLAAALTSGINTDDLTQRLQLNPHARTGTPLASHNKNMIIHAEDESFPWEQTVLAVQLIRFFSILLGAGSIVCTYLLGLTLFPQRPALAVGAMAFHAFLPMFLFISASVNNDNLVIFLASLSLLLIVRLLFYPKSRRFLLVLGIVIGLAALTKLSALGLIPLAGLALLMRRFLPHYQTWPINRFDSHRRFWALSKELIYDGMVLFLPVTLIAGWWYYRNWSLYGEPLGMQTMLDIVGRRPAPPSWLELWGEMPGLVINFWGLFGGVNILMQPLWIYNVLNAAALVALAGLGIWGYQRWRAREIQNWHVGLLLMLWIVIIFVALLRWTSATYASQGRLLFPTLPAISILFILGINAWFPERYAWRVTLGVATALALLAFTVPFTSIQPAYARPPILTVEALPETIQPYNVTYGGVMKLLGYEVDQTSVRPGDSLAVTLYWQALAPMERDYSIFIQLFSQDRQRFFQIDSYPGGGAYPTSFWQPGQVMGFTYQATIEAQPPQPTAAFLEVGLYDLQTWERLQATDEKGEVTPRPYLTRVKVQSPTAPLTPQHTVDINFDNRVRLVGYDYSVEVLLQGKPTPLILYWHVLAPLPTDYTIFVHLVDEDGQIANQADGPPLQGAYPTSYWEAGEWLIDPHQFGGGDPLPERKYRIAVGFYEPESGQRLPVINSGGEITGDAGILVAFGE